MLARPAPKTLTAPKSVTIQSETVNDVLTPIPNPTMMGMPVLVHRGAQPKTHQIDGTPLLFPTVPPSPPQPWPLVLRRILSCTSSGKNGENMDRTGELIRNIGERRKILEDQNRKIFHPPPIEGIDVSVTKGARDTGS